MNLIFTCGGTAGHINPAIAVANLMRERHPNSRILFIGAAGHMEEKLVPQAGFELKTLHVEGLARGKSFDAIKKNVKAVKEVMDAIGQCKKLFAEFQPDVVFGTGCYASFPALYAASSMKIPTVIHESNAVPGLTNKLAAKNASKILVAFEESVANYSDTSRVEVVGMPIRREFLYTDRQEARKALGIDSRPLVVSAFGSLGAKVMNEETAELFAMEQRDGFPYQHIHATGGFGWEWMPKRVQDMGVDLSKAGSIDMREYIYDMPTVMEAADLIISRAGASTCNEIAACGIPSILIPSPNVTNNHQEKNARVLEARGGAVVILEKECTAEKLYSTIHELLADPARREEMGKNLRQIVRLDSTERICDIIEDLIRK